LDSECWKGDEYKLILFGRKISSVQKVKVCLTSGAMNVRKKGTSAQRDFYDTCQSLCLQETNPNEGKEKLKGLKIKSCKDPRAPAKRKKGVILPLV